MWNEVYVENEIAHHPRVLNILEKVASSPLYLDRYDEIWGRSKKPYLHKRDSLNLFLASKKGQLIKEAPDAYGLSGEPHYYFIHAYNCIYECQYCYLQGYFNTPDIVIFVNHEEIIAQMEKTLEVHAGKRVWFHAGEFSDSLALTHLTGELELYHQFCRENPRACIELRTKSVNLKELEKLEPLPNLIISYSLSPADVAQQVDQKTPSTSSRIKALQKLHSLGFSIGLHFDPIIYRDNFKTSYQQMLSTLECGGINSSVMYLSLGVVRFTKDVFHEVERNYPDSILHAQPFIKSFDNKVRYQRPMRRWMMNAIKELAIQHGIAAEKIYLCMEDNA